MHRATSLALWPALLGCCLVSCVYDPPPEVTLLWPSCGVFLSGDPLLLEFSEPIEPASLRVRVWPPNRDVEGAIPPRTLPLLDSCRATDSPCGDTEVSVAENGLSAELFFHPDGLGKPNAPMILEIQEGLADLAGETTGLATWYDLQFFPLDYLDPSDPATDKVPFVDGIYVIVSTMDQPLPVWLTLITEILSLPDNSVALAGAEGDEIGDAPRTTTDAAELIVDSTEEGYTVYATGSLSQRDGQRYLTTDPFPISVRTGPMYVSLASVRLNSLIVEKDGHDYLEGTLSFEGVTVRTGDIEFSYGSGSNSFVGQYAPPDIVPEGVPQICGDLCGAVTSQCNPPDDFPPDGFCVEE
ncbi:MAG: hypothetical protein JW797_20115 [Bradymonadales bacterium]|nr:hypothetical protein [Bradymonadales bacterium]